jgi:hypothetical protein
MLLVLSGAIQALRILSNLIDPVELDYGEGIILFQATEVLSLKTAFHPLEQYPHVVFHYTPLYHLAVRAVMSVVHNILLSGRLVSMAATVWIVGILMWVVLSATRGYAPEGVRWYAAVFTGAWVLVLPPIQWSPWARVDLLGLAFQLTGLSVLAVKPFRLRNQIVAFGLLLLGLFTKQSLVAIPAASILLMVVIRPVRALLLAAGMAAAGAAIVLVLAWQTQGSVLRHWILYNVNPFRMKQALTLLSQYSSNLMVLIATAVTASWLTFPRTGRKALGRAAMRLWRSGPLESAGKSGQATFRRAPWHPRWRSASARLAASPVRRTGLGFGLAVVCGFVVSWGIGKDGANMNYCLDWQLALCPLAGIFMVLFLRRWMEQDRGMAMLRPVLFLALGSTALVLGVQTLIDCNNAGGWSGSAREKRLIERREQAELVKMISTFPGPVVSENMTLLLRAGKPVPFEPAIIKQTTDTGIFDERPLVKRTADKFFDAFILYTGTGRFSPAMWDAIHRNYRSYVFGTGAYTVYVRSTT